MANNVSMGCEGPAAHMSDIGWSTPCVLAMFALRYLWSVVCYRNESIADYRPYRCFQVTCVCQLTFVCSEIFKQNFAYVPNFMVVNKCENLETGM